MKRVFISLPYTDEDRSVVECRLRTAQKYFLELLKEEYCPVCPILVGDGIVQTFGLDNSFDYWKNYCLAELESCDIVHVLMIDGWNESYGVSYEINWAAINGKEVKYISM